jgi:uncharacterized protein with FMN-binding domain
MEEKKGNGMVVGVVAVVVLALAGVGGYLYMNKNSSAPVETPVTPNTPNTRTSYLYKDGNYSATGAYVSPGGPESINVSLTLKNDVVTDATVTASAGNPTSESYQNIFKSSFKTMVVGKKLADVKLDKVSGSSLTPLGWNEAIVKIQAQAKA